MDLAETQGDYDTIPQPNSPSQFKLFNQILKNKEIIIEEIENNKRRNEQGELRHLLCTEKITRRRNMVKNLHAILNLFANG